MIYDCCDHCDHGINDPPHGAPCPEGCTDPPEYDPEAAAADQAEEWAAGQAELAAIESDEARDARAEAAAGAFDPDALGDPDSRPVGA